MISYPFTYVDILEESSGFTSETVVNEISEYWFDEINQTNFNRGYRFGLLVFGTSSLFFTSKAAFASDSGMLPAGDDGANCPAPGPVPEAAKPKPGSLVVIPSTDRCAYGVSALGIYGIAMKTGAYWIGFVCAAALIIVARMASFQRSIS